ncbi:MAG: sodium:proton antiporter [Lachnospiraceae bacterium]|jgi:CPA1 family monovalent cation:H+ antiporter|nr:sodium:proton antiporter [Lachnospiraceae bacterium]
MELIYFILILITAVLLSNLINHFVPLLSLPLVQIILGVLIAFIPPRLVGSDFTLDPEWFFVLFVAPLVFHSARKADLKSMRRLGSPILLAAFGLVIVTVFVVGYFTHLLLPTIPLVAAFAMIAALGPTDVVAVEAVAHRVAMPRRIVNILSGESILNDATGIACFQYAIVAAATGVFSIISGVWTLFVLALGGLFLGIIVTALKFRLVRWLRSNYIVTPSLHIAIGITIPFIVFMIAEWVGVSGILAVFGSAIYHVLYKDKYNPEIISEQNAYEGTWAVLSFSFDGLVFVILGTQLPRLMRVSGINTDFLDGMMIFGCILAINLALLFIRFVWWVITVRPRVYNDPAEPISIMRAGMIYSVAGARGAISMASILSIPLLLADGTAFPERDLIILVTCGVIIISLLMTNFVLPLLVANMSTTTAYDLAAEREAHREILETVANRLWEKASQTNHAATGIIVHYYHARMNIHLSIDEKSGKDSPKTTGSRFRRRFLAGEKDFLVRMAERGQVSETIIEHIIEENKAMSKGKLTKKNSFFASCKWLIVHLREAALVTRVRNERTDKEAHNMENSIVGIALFALGIERELIHEMMEAGRLSPRTAKEMTANIIYLEAELHAAHQEESK